MVQTLTLCGISNGMRKSLATHPKDFRNTPQRLWQYIPKTLGTHPKDFGKANVVPCNASAYTMQQYKIKHTVGKFCADYFR